MIMYEFATHIQAGLVARLTVAHFRSHIHFSSHEARCCAWIVLFHGMQSPGHAVIHYFNITVRVHKYVICLQIAMCDSNAVEVHQALNFIRQEACERKNDGSTNQKIGGKLLREMVPFFPTLEGLI